MSLRAKVFLLFATFAVAPLLLVGIFDYVHSVAALGALVQGENQLLARRMAGDLADAVAGERTAVAALARDPVVRGTLQGGGTQAALDGLLASQSELTGIELRDAEGQLVARAGALSDPADCVDGHQRLVRLREPVPGSGASASIGTLTAHLPFTRLFPTSLVGTRMGASGEIMIIDRGSGRVLNHRDCGTLSAINGEDAPGGVGALRTAAARLTAAHDMSFRFRGASREAALTPVPSGDWVVASAFSPQEFTGPYADSRILYLLLVVFIALATALAFSMLLKRVMHSLTELIGAADQIADGNFMPWLPLPGSGEVGRLTLAFGGMVSRLRELVQQLEVTRPLAVIGEFAPNLAHEIRNPLSSIRLNLQDMARSVNRGRAPADMREPVEICLNEVNRLDRVVQSVLRLAQSEDEAGWERVSIHDCVLDTTRMLTAEMRARGITLQLGLTREGDGFVMGDPAQVQSVFINLVRNAMEAMPDGGPLRIWTVWERSGTNPVLRVHVRDAGSGVLQDLRNRIFQPFFTTKSNGTGLGLPYSLRTVREYGGRLYLERRSELERGAEFVVELPAAPAGGTPPEAQRDAATMSVARITPFEPPDEQTELALRS